MAGRIEGKVALITGGGAGIGRAGVSTPSLPSAQSRRRIPSLLAR